MENDKKNLQTTKETQAKIKLMMIYDYEQQLEELKQNKSNYEYKAYRYKYMLLYNAIKWNKQQYKKLMGE